MKQIIDFVPLLLFFVVYKLEPTVVAVADLNVAVGGIFSATAALIAGSLGLTLLFKAGQAVYLVHHMQPDPEPKES